MFASQSKQEQNDTKFVGKDPNHTISADPAVIQRGKAQFSSQPNKRKAESQVK